MKQGMGVVVTETCLRTDLDCWGSSNFVSEALCSRMSNFGGGGWWEIYNKNSPIFQGTELTGSLISAWNQYLDRPDSELMAIQDGNVALCNRRVSNSLGLNTNVLVMNMHPYAGYAEFGGYESLVINGLKFTAAPTPPTPTIPPQCIQYIGCFGDNSIRDLDRQLQSSIWNVRQWQFFFFFFDLKLSF